MAYEGQQPTMEEPEQPAQNYGGLILAEWYDIIALSQEFRISMMSEEYDDEICRRYISKLTRLWLELEPKVRERKDFGQWREDFLKLDTYAADPTKFFVDNPNTEKDEEAEGIPNSDELYRFERVMRWIIEKLLITRF